MEIPQGQTSCFGLKTAMQEMKLMFGSLEHSIDVLRDISKIIVSASSITFSLFSVLLLLLKPSQNLVNVRNIIWLIATLIFFIVLLILSYLIIKPTSFYEPFFPTYDSLSSSLCGVSEEIMLAQMLSNYEAAYVLNIKSIKKKRILLLISSVLYLIILISLILFAFLSSQIICKYHYLGGVLASIDC